MMTFFFLFFIPLNQVKESLDSAKKKTTAVRGIVIAKKNHGISSNFTILSVVMDDVIEIKYPTHSPMIESVKVS